MKDKGISSLEHTSWRCQYDIVFAPKYRRVEIYGAIREDIGMILRKAVPAKRSRNNRSSSMPGSYPYADKYTPKIQCEPDRGISKGEEQSNDI